MLLFYYGISKSLFSTKQNCRIDCSFPFWHIIGGKKKKKKSKQTCFCNEISQIVTPIKWRDMKIFTPWPYVESQKRNQVGMLCDPTLTDSTKSFYLHRIPARSHCNSSLHSKDEECIVHQKIRWDYRYLGQIRWNL